MLLAASAAFVGLVHSLAPGHWLPVVLMTKTKHWGVRNAVLGAITAAAGHILISIALAAVGLEIGAHFLIEREALIERYAGLGLVVFGLGYAALSLVRHRSCHGHEHHGPELTAQREKAPFIFLFMLGFSPCVAVLPLFVAAAPIGVGAVVMTMVGFAVGVLGALISATVLVSRGIMRLDHPIFEHYGDLLTGLGVALMGAVLFFFFPLMD